jgi:hypothetical protein
MFTTASEAAHVHAPPPPSRKGLEIFPQIAQPTPWPKTPLKNHRLCKRCCERLWRSSPFKSLERRRSVQRSYVENYARNSMLWITSKYNSSRKKKTVQWNSAGQDKPWSTEVANDTKTTVQKHDTVTEIITQSWLVNEVCTAGIFKLQCCKAFYSSVSFK